MIFIINEDTYSLDSNELYIIQLPFLYIKNIYKKAAGIPQLLHLQGMSNNI
ncbi:conserved hypothetical protein [Bacillus cereus AH820]|uniref:Uncharacterized protein n=1 Tax=Bacillus cereus (strain AH820) TaxID=405535 RepID=B7JH53_BACC0|nr:conserved hypothetical protein [Bacillus cereus AH820]EEM58916.1 hypothetical protein bthur0007_32410 [Bacillus thuringiensis serovar monterrey BGSC 4AJ1]